MKILLFLNQQNNKESIKVSDRFIKEFISRINNFFFSIFITSCFFLFSCKSDESANWNVDLLAPLAKINLSIANIISDSLIQTNLDHSISLAYNDTIFNLDFDSIFKMPDTTINTFFKSPILTAIQPGQLFFVKSDKVKLKIPDVLLSKVEAKSGRIKYFIKSSISEKTKFVYEIPKALKNGASLKITRYIPASNNGAFGEISGEIDVSGFSFDLTGEFFNSANIIQTNMKVYNDSSSNIANISPNDSIKFYVSFEKIVPNFAKGYFGQQTQATGAKTVDFSIFNKIISGDINLLGAFLSITFINYLGIDAKIILNSLVSVNDKTGNSTPLSSIIIGKHINISRAKMINQSASGIEPSVIKLEIEALAAKQFIENLPDKIKYNLNIAMNPLGNISGGNDFIYYGKGFKAILNFEMPLVFSSNALTIADTANFTFDSDIFNNINGGKLNIIANNTFPIQAKLKMILLDDTKSVIETIAPTQFIEASENLNFTNPLTQKKSIIPVFMTSSRIDNFRKTKYICFTVAFTSIPQNQHITIFDNHTLDLKLTADFSYNINN